MHQFNANHMLRNHLRQMIIQAGIKLPSVVAERDKAYGFMGTRGSYKVGECEICTYGHYKDENDDSHYSLKMYRGKDAWWHLGMDEQGKVWFSPTGCFREKIENLTDWEQTDLILDR